MIKVEYCNIETFACHNTKIQDILLSYKKICVITLFTIYMNNGGFLKEIFLFNQERKILIA